MGKLGRLEKVNPRDVWKTEDRDFTPWLAKEENISLLGEAIGLSLEVEAEEKAVGPFRADILCLDTSNDSWVLVENQLERTDHTHLGQLMTYASGLKAVTIVWVAKKFTEEHRSSLDWLNEITDDTFNFFGLEIELWKIGDSHIAPKFNVVSKPNNWSRSVAAASKSVHLSDSRLFQRDYWTAFGNYLESNSNLLKLGKPQPQQWMNISLGKAGLRLCCIASYKNSQQNTWSTGEIRAEFYLDSINAKSHYEQFLAKKDIIEESFGEKLIWHNLDNQKSARVYLPKAVDIKNQNDWNNQHKWLMEKLEKLKQSFTPHFKDLTDE